MKPADMLVVERLGGLAGFGGSGAKLRSRGTLDLATLTAADRRVVEALFDARGAAAPAGRRDGFRYRITRTTPTGTETIEACETTVPAALGSCVRDELV